MGTTTISTSSGDRGLVISGRAGRLLFALLLSSPGEQEDLHTLANVPRKLMDSAINELLGALEDWQAPELAPSDAQTIVAKVSLAQVAQESTAPQQKYLAPAPVPEDPEDYIAEGCREADQVEEPVARLRAQATAVIGAWRLFFPKLAYAEEIIHRQDLRPNKAKEWINLASTNFPGHEAITVFGWLGGVDEGKLLSIQHPLAYVNKVVSIKSQEAKQKPGEPEDNSGGEDVPDSWRQYAQKLIDQGVNNHGSKNGRTNLQRIARAVADSPAEP